MKYTHIFLLCVFILGCGKINTSPEFFKPDEKCYVVVESSLSLNEKFKELLKEALKDNKKNEIEDSNLEYQENYGGIQERVLLRVTQLHRGKSVECPQRLYRTNAPQTNSAAPWP